MTSRSDPHSTDIDAEALLRLARDALVAVDAVGRITAWQGSAATLLGWTAGEAVGRPFADIFDLDAVGPSQSGERTVTATHRDGRRLALQVRLASRADGGFAFAARAMWPEELAVTLGRELNVTRLATIVTQWARQLTGGQHAALYLRVDGSEPPAFVPENVDGASHLLVSGQREVVPDHLGPDWRLHPLFVEGRSQFVAEAAAEADRHGFPEMHPDIGSYIGHALFDKAGAVLGVLLVGDQRPHAFDADAYHTARVLAGQAGVAVQNAQLYARMQRALRDSETLRFIGQQLAGQVDAAALLNQLVRHARAILDADIAAVAAVDADGTLRWVAAAGFDSSRYQDMVYQTDGGLQGLQGRIVAARQPVMVEVPGHELEFPVLAAESVHVAFGVPLLRGNTAVGALIAGNRRPMTVTAHEIALAQALASHASVSLENARLIAEADQRAAEAIADRRLLRAVLDSLPVGVIIADAATREVTHLNQMGRTLIGRALEGTRLADAGRLLSARRPDGTAFPMDELPLVQALDGGETVTGVELSVQHADGTIVPLLLNAAPVTASDGALVAGVLAFQDVTPLKEVDRIKDEFLSVASHELKTPLTPLLGLTQLMLRTLDRGRPPAPEQLAANLRSIHRQALHMSELVNDLLDVSRIQTGRLELRPQPLDLIVLAAEVLERFQSLSAASDTRRLRLRSPVQSLTGAWDRARLDQVLTNLVSNAIKYSPAGSEVTLAVEPRGDAVRISVRDRGIGIPQHEQARLFEPFYRASNASIRNYAGVGLGLHITREIVARHGGTISVESEEGKGSTFIVDLPLRTEDGTRPQE
jgi:signal transduction histidine kinase